MHFFRWSSSALLMGLTCFFVLSGCKKKPEPFEMGPGDSPTADGSSEGHPDSPSSGSHGKKEEKESWRKLSTSRRVEFMLDRKNDEDERAKACDSDRFTGHEDKVIEYLKQEEKLSELNRCLIKGILRVEETLSLFSSDAGTPIKKEICKSVSSTLFDKKTVREKALEIAGKDDETAACMVDRLIDFSHDRDRHSAVLEFVKKVAVGSRTYETILDKAFASLDGFNLLVANKNEVCGMAGSPFSSGSSDGKQRLWDVMNALIGAYMDNSVYQMVCHCAWHGCSNSDCAKVQAEAMTRHFEVRKGPLQHHMPRIRAKVQTLVPGALYDCAAAPF